jgi:peptidoglycan/LPS O-acetylase OafA/YrhL
MRICVYASLGRHCAGLPGKTPITLRKAFRRFTQVSRPARVDASRPDRVANATLAYRPDIDGLRGVAVGLVVAYHAFPGFRTGGFVGVDVFFVISGYLITELILTGLQAGTFSLGEFYRRRVRRIVPALLVVMTACCIFGWLVLLPSELEWLGKSISYSASFLANMFFARTGGYFERTAELNPLLHLWSLGVEEQFYLAWPVLLMLAVRHGVTMRVLIAVIVPSLAISIWGAWYSPTQHFYYPASRAWELAAGGILAAWQLGVPRGPATDFYFSSSRSRRWFGAQALSLAGLALIVVGGVCWTADNPIPGVWSVIPTAGAAMLIAAGPRAPVNRWLLGSPPLTFVGRISYPLYLWHWPLLSFTRVVVGHAPQPTLAAAEIAVSFVAAYATYRLVEAPIRFDELGRRAVPGLLAGLAALALIGAAAGAGGIPGRLSGPLFAKWDAAVTDWHYPDESNFERRSGLGTVTVPSHRETKVLFIGDSHIQQYWPRVQHIIDAQPDSARTAVFAVRRGCPPMPGINTTWRAWNCSRSFDYAVEQAFQPGVDTVVFGAFWESYFLGEYSEDHSLRPVQDVQAHTRAPLELDSPDTRIAFEQFRNTVARLVSSGRRVFIVLSNPTSPLFDPVFPSWIRLSLRLPGSLPAGSSPRIDAGPFETFVAPVMNRLRDIAAQTGAQVVDPRSTLCDQMICPAAGPDEMPLYLDSNHLSGYAARQRASFVDAMLLGPETQSGTSVSISGSQVPPFKQ